MVGEPRQKKGQRLVALAQPRRKNAAASDWPSGEHNQASPASETGQARLELLLIDSSCRKPGHAQCRR
jgi:hypothetical protein